MPSDGSAVWRELDFDPSLRSPTRALDRARFAPLRSSRQPIGADSSAMTPTGCSPWTARASSVRIFGFLSHVLNTQGLQLAIQFPCTIAANALRRLASAAGGSIRSSSGICFNRDFAVVKSLLAMALSMR